MKKILPIFLLTLAGLSSSVFSFDGNRKGFVLGGGLGLAPAVTVSADLKETVTGDGQFSLYGLRDTRVGAAINFLVGYAWDDRNMIVLEGNGAAFEDSDVLVSQSFSGASWYHYFGPLGQSAFTAVGIGLYGIDTDKTDRADAGAGLLLGGGYEFARHWQVGGYLSFGATSLSEAGVDIDLKHSTFSVVITAIAF